MTTPIRLMLTGGGTGGHLFPAIATAEAMCERLPGTEVLFVGTGRRMDKAGLEQYGYATCSIHSKGLKGKNLLSLLLGILVLPVSCLEAMYHILRFKPDIVVGVGGYVTGPVMIAAKFFGKPTLIHEQNSIPGLANRKLGTMVARICLSLPGSERSFPQEKTVLTGNPVRSEILKLSESGDSPDDKPLVLLVLGGSLGAHRVNELVSTAFTLGLSGLKNIRVIHQTGPEDAEEVEAIYKRNGVDATVAPFFTDMAAIYKEADLLVSRAGATTLAELAVLGKPALLIPYPYAADNHQEKNAEYYVQAGGALMFVERDLTAEVLAEQLVQFFENPAKLKKMSRAMKSRAFPKAAEHIVDECLGLLNHTPQP
ncbi:UDP-N-acetylglucosamine--N-acetylmuramyl-(pentapeptide) pyrophosphoryl-undecaprenol N-acetylglucosamine transferase [Desulfocapsa sulfexigens DSM 10523]|uniref:UDP-N-acetylglucosamine--N-acetylmuramyl-(pentapeptide) pyrophosphoryl-undecaprenol N-acetylglucosamine transferase n=1 Tax=Desulfocapsa sulfexigens (strain DSM 10523 / SB164P1) TaxID=1167006 RepID=M1PEN3_DESSD|nr:undecaprenyldiphospho-muramoylpentapeptide beta-N-acetylglucosaminyltransferase [Desulfocapsa sulfexigens]AGF80002.1 UDP-N-acetylglucosamine--N-acetylmuramyl-(pentapeptide) pyrophosphoryl-undecaprenol N-acetylglucosamine transferase [Desulfocapsa sulfexigens DSM 10523]